ncbi:MAG: L-seryl-tRNA(Sec) selenium transferase [Acidobacteriaceae bacterium]|nr:L-seryl-tRNA(Sec) selenium transferase [Acidobacteriaceae bacterium]MBV9781631.1 L-seryl-tRNA(Sec) selenium transferase [Acidobacteriaceae bacterium]
MQSVRTLPSVDEVLRQLKHLDRLPRKLLANEVRAELAERRKALINGADIGDIPVAQAVENRIAALLRPSLRPVINASGVILHTNLGRAPLADFDPIPRYSNLEYDLETGRRGKRDVHTARLLEHLLGLAAIVVNNNAAAVYLVLNELAANHEVIVSRGELIEIGDGFRIPEIMTRSGAILREVGTTNRTHVNDYREAINDRTRLILRVHPSNFRVTGFTERPELKDLVQLGRAHDIPVYEDLGSGCLVDLHTLGIDEPLVSDSLAAGAHLVSFSCDKLLGGPQSGIVAGDAELVHRVRRNPMYRAFRVDKLIVEALETTLRHVLKGSWQSIPTLQMIFTSVEEIHQRAERVLRRLEGLNAVIREDESAIGGGSTPDQVLTTWVVELAVHNPVAFEGNLRRASVPVIARIERDKIILDMRTVADQEEESLVSAVHAAMPRVATQSGRLRS